MLKMSEKTAKLELPHNVVPLNPLPGGKDPTVNWLADLKQGTSFVSKRRMPKGHEQLFLDEWTLINNRTKSFLLFTDLNPQAEVYVRVDPKDSSRHNELVEVLEEGEE
jgi:hypothetical protein